MTSRPQVLPPKIVCYADFAEIETPLLREWTPNNALPYLGGPLTRLPAAVPADGNCLFHALSIAIVGESLDM